MRRREAQPNLWRLVCAYRDHGHRVADLDPLQLTPRSGEEGKEREGEGRKGEREREGKGRNGEREREGKGRKGREREGKGRNGREREGKGRIMEEENVVEKARERRRSDGMITVKPGKF